MSATWLPLAGGIVPIPEQSGPLQAEERFAARQRALESARSEYQARHYDAAEQLLAELIPALRELAESAEYALLLAQSLVLQARLHWRRGEREKEHGNDPAAAEAAQTQAFLEALQFFERHKATMATHPAQSRLYTDFGIALYRTEQREAATGALKEALATGVPPVEAFAYLGMAWSDQAQYPAAIDALQKGLQLAPRDRVLLETLAITLARDGQTERAVRTYCQAAIEAANNDDLISTRRMLRAALAAQPEDPQALSMLTLMLRSQNKADEARQLLDATLMRSPFHPWALGLRGMLHADAGDTPAAVRDFEAVRAETADLAWVWLEHAKAVAGTDHRAAERLLARARTKLVEGDPRLPQAEAEVAVRAALALAGREVGSLIKGTVSWLAESKLVRGVTDRFGIAADRLASLARKDPIELLRLAARALPDRIEPHEALARIYLQRGDWLGAAAALEEATRLAPDSAAVLGLRAKLAEAQGDAAEALRLYRRATRAAPEDNTAFGQLIEALNAQGRSDEALRELERKLAEMPDFAPALVEKGRILVKLKRFAESLEALVRAQPLVEGGNLLAARILLGRALSGLNRHEEAQRAFTDALPIDNPIGDAHSYLALLLINTAEYEQAAALLEQAIVRAEGWRGRLAWLHSSRGWALYCARNTPFAELERIFRKSLDLLPDAPFARKNLGQVLIRMPDRMAEGRDIFDRLTELSAGQAPPDLVGWCHFRLGRLQAAEHWLRAAISDDPENATIRFDLALLLLALGSTEAPAAYDAALAFTAACDRPRQRGLLHVAALDVRESIEDGVIDRAIGGARLDDLLDRLRGAGVAEGRLRPLQLRTGVAAAT